MNVLSFAITLISIIFMAWLFFTYRNKEAEFSVSNMLTSVGILFTFIGICLALFFFDPTNIDQSIVSLLDGLKVAFVSSVCGIALSILYRAFSFPIIKDKVNITNATIDDIVLYQTKLIELQDEFNKKSLSQFSNIERALIGDGDCTLLSQIQKMRTTFSDKQDELTSEFKEFAKNMTQNNMDALTTAIQNLITDFNKKITDEFGENFKQLNIAVEKLVIWQENYKDQVDTMITQLDQSTKAIHLTEKSISAISEHSNKITVMAENLDGLLKILTTELSAFSEMGEKAKTAFPYINKEIEKLTEGLHGTVEKITLENEKMLQFNQESLNNQSKTLTNHHTDVINQINTSMNNTNNQLEKFVNENSERIANQVAELDKALGEELEKTISSLGSQLHSLSNKFVEDYLPLTERLKKVVEIAERV